LSASAEAERRGAVPGAGAETDEEDFYSLLGVTYTASHAEITRAYRRAMKRAHPDRQPAARRAAAEAYARQLNAAYATLSDPIKRLAYDRTIRQQVIQDQIMRRYVGGFENVGGTRRTSPYARHEPTEAERRERSQSDRRAWTLLLLVAVAVTALIIVSVLLGAVFGSLFRAVL
jgi:DnaJ-class molecular chaperone